MPRRVLIVGGVAGGASATARLRRLDEEAEIVLFDRPALLADVKPPGVAPLMASVIRPSVESMAVARPFTRARMPGEPGPRPPR